MAKIARKSLKKSPSKTIAPASSAVVTIDRRRPKTERRTKAATPTVAVVEAEASIPPAPTLERRAKTPRRRQIDPTTCERDYSIEEVEFMNALDDYKRKSGRMFPTCSEVLEVIRALGYVKPMSGATGIETESPAVVLETVVEGGL
jgi:hypothetical protein